jgi:hypothetical protein
MQKATLFFSSQFYYGFILLKISPQKKGTVGIVVGSPLESEGGLRLSRPHTQKLPTALPAKPKKTIRPADNKPLSFHCPLAEPAASMGKTSKTICDSRYYTSIIKDELKTHRINKSAGEIDFCG